MQQRSIPQKGTSPQKSVKGPSRSCTKVISHSVPKAESSFVPEALQRNLYELRIVSKLEIQFFKGLAPIEHISCAVLPQLSGGIEPSLARAG